MNVRKTCDRFNQRRIRVRSRNNLQQSHVTWRIKKVRAEPRFAEILRESFCNFCYRQTAGVGRDDGSRLAELLHSFEQRSLDLEVLNNYLDDPINFGDPL